MLPAASRLRRRREFQLTLRRGRRVGRSAIVVHLYVAPEGGTPRAGFVVGRAVGAAVTRNLVRRRLRHAVRLRLDALPHGSLLVVRALPAAAGRRFEELDRELLSALRGLGVGIDQER